MASSVIQKFRQYAASTWPTGTQGSSATTRSRQTVFRECVAKGGKVPATRAARLANPPVR